MTGQIFIKNISLCNFEAEALIYDEDGGYSYEEENLRIESSDRLYHKADSPHWNLFDKKNLKQIRMLYKAYENALEYAKENNKHSIGVRLLSKGHKAFPDNIAWDIAIQACQKFFTKYPDFDMTVTFCTAGSVQTANGIIALKRNKCI